MVAEVGDLDDVGVRVKGKVGGEVCFVETVVSEDGEYVDWVRLGGKEGVKERWKKVRERWFLEMRAKRFAMEDLFLMLETA